MNFDDRVPFRGPSEFSEGNFKYTFEMQGDYKYFKGQERVYYNGKCIFLQDIMGSLVK